MTVYMPLNGVSLLTGSSDPDPLDPRTVSHLGSTSSNLVVSWPHAVDTTGGLRIRVYENGTMEYDTASAADHPGDGSTISYGSFKYRLTDGIDPGNEATFSVELTGYDVPDTTSDIIQDGLVMDFRADAGVTLSGSDVTAWVEQANSVATTVVGTPQMGTTPGGTIGESVVIGADQGFTFSDMSNLPVGNSPRTMQVVWSPVTGSFFYGGFGYGNSSLGTNWSFIVDNNGELALDYGSERIGLGMSPADEWLICSATYSAGVISVWIGQFLVATAAVVLTTGTTRGNIGRSFSNVTTTCEIARAVEYGEAKSDADILSNVSVLNDQFIGDETVADHSAATASNINSGGFTFSGTGTNTFGHIAYSVRTSSTPATEAEIIAGTGALEYGFLTLAGLADFTYDVTGGAAATGYYVNTIEYDLVGGKSGVVTSALITTTGAAQAPTDIQPDTFNVTESFPSGGTLGTLIADQPSTFSEITDTANAFAVSSGGLFTSTTSLVSSQSPYAFVVRALANGQTFDKALTINVSGTSGASPYAADASFTTRAGVEGQIAAWIANPSGTIPAGKTATDPRVVAITQPTSGDWQLHGYNASAITGGIIVRGVAPYTDGSSFPFSPKSFSHVNGVITTSGSTGIGLALLSCKHVNPSNMPAGFFMDQVSCVSEWSTTRSSPNVTGQVWASSPGAVSMNSYFSGFSTYIFSIASGMNGAIYEGCFTDYARDDHWKGQGAPTSFGQAKFRRNWAGRDVLSSSSAHSDYVQCQLGCLMPDLEFYGNVHMTGNRLLAGKHLQFLFMSEFSQGSRSHNSDIQQNIYAGSAAQGFWWLGNNITCFYNDAVLSEIGSHGAVQPSATNPPSLRYIGTQDYCINTKTVSSNTNTSAGPNGVEIINGNLSNGGVANTSQIPTYYAGFPAWDTYIDAIKPPSTSAVTHWSFGGQRIGAYKRKEEIFSLGIHPGNVGWPVAGPWHRQYAPIGTAAFTAVNSTFTGSYDANGNNA